MVLVVALGLCAICIVPFFFPSTVFAPYPLDVTAPTPTEHIKVKATGKFQKLESLDPLEMGKGTQNFTNAVANIIPRAEQDVMIYIHHIVKTKRYGITISTRETDWAAFLNADIVRAVQAGKLYGWKDKWAVRFEVLNPKGKQDELFLTFEDAGAQMSVVNLLRQLHFEVMMAEMAY